MLMMVCSLHCINDSFFLSVFQAMLTLSEGGSTGNLIQSVWTLWRATLDTSAWIFLAVAMCELFFFFLPVENQTIFFVFFWQWRGVNGTETFFFSVRGWSSLLSLWQCFTPFLIHRSVLTFFSGKLKCVPPDLAPPVQLYFHIYFCTSVPARLSSRLCAKPIMQTRR